jgi:hypothetical protein
VLLVLMLAMLVLPAAARPSVRGNVQDRFTFRGSGGKTLAPFRVHKPSTLRWSASGGIFQIFNRGLSTGGSVNSRAASGASYMPPGRYRLTVNAVAAWRIMIAPGIERPRSFGGGLVGFSGNGGRELPPFTTKHGTTLRWRASGGLFQLFSKGLSGPDVNSQASHGTTYMDAGKHQVMVNAVGSWRISWRP